MRREVSDFSAYKGQDMVAMKQEGAVWELKKTLRDAVSSCPYRSVLKVSGFLHTLGLNNCAITLISPILESMGTIGHETQYERWR